MQVFAYARVSSADQNLSRQVESFLEFGVERQNIYSDKVSGKDFVRENYTNLVGKLKKGDLLIVKSIDRLGRNYDMIIEEWAHITKQIGADILVLDMPLLDTRGHDNDLTGKFISDLVLQILSYVAQQERENIRARQREGINLALSQGVKFGRPAKIPEDLQEIITLYKNKEITFMEALSRSGLSKSSFYRKLT